MDNASVIDGACFADATCQQLMSLVLESGSVSPERKPPESLLTRLKQLLGQDDCFRRWADETLRRNGASTQASNGSTSVDHKSVIKPNSDYGRLALRLPELLISYPPTDWIADQPVASNLLSACHLAIRLRVSEASMASELRERQHAAIYNFAYGLSHELNNPLANIATRAGILTRDEKNLARRQMLESIVENAMRGCEMLGDLMLVARPPSYQRRAVPAAPMLEQLGEQAQHWAQPFSVAVVCKLDVPATLFVDEQALREALWALIRNAIESVQSEGKVTIKANVSENSAHIVIQDDGAPLSPQALKYCFDPYYSGREAGRGLGLGLTKAQRIVESFSGKLSIENLPGGGSSALVVLPCSLDCEK